MLKFLEIWFQENPEFGSFYGEQLRDALREVFRTLEKQNHSGSSYATLISAMPVVLADYQKYLMRRTKTNRS